MIILFCILLSAENVFGDEVRISSTDDFINFITRVNSMISYIGTTVFLDSDLSLSGYDMNPIGNSSSYYLLGIFGGVFDGQGYVINNLNISKSSQRVGLFGYSNRLTIRNVILDSSCSITNSYSSSNNNIYVSGIIGYCSEQCKIENNVNMASVTFSGSISSSYSLYLGGIAGYLYSGDYSIYVKNCANYGSVTHSGTSYRSYVGGIVGYLASSYYKYIHNCLNYGTITHNGTTSLRLYLGGIAGNASYTYIENCVSAGTISSPSKSDYVGSLVGYAGSDTYINYCYYTDELSGYNMYGRGTPESTSNTHSYSSSTFELNETIIISNYSGLSLIYTLNAYSDYMLRGYSHWLLNKDSKSVSFIINGRTNPIKMDYQIILLPNLASEGNISFDGWYNDRGCTTSFTSYKITTETSLYGKFEENILYTITFNTRGGTPVSPKQAQFRTTVSLPNSSTKDYCVIASWKNIRGDNVGFSLTMIAQDITLYAVWKCTHIKTPDDFLDFSKVVNSGISYLGTTVFLDSDLSLSGYAMNSIGNSSSNYFRGVFDGQGYVINNLNITKSPRYAGLFGYSNGLTIRNVILDSSCSITNSYSGSSYVYIGGIIGYCEAYKGQCNIENNVNIASVSFSGNISSVYLLSLGGIAGCLESSSGYKSTVKNCANYGSVTHSGTSGNSYIGGIVAYLSSSYYKYIYNCLNYGTITHNGTTTIIFFLGGIDGYVYYTYIKNCVSAGKIISNKESNYIGSIIGYFDSNMYINYCYYTDELSGYDIYGIGSPANNSNTPSEVNITLISYLNSQVTSDNGWNKWLLNSNNKTITFKVNNNIGFSLSSQIILFPDPIVNNSFVFSGWYTDPYYNDPFQSDEVSESMTLYSLYGVIANVTFNATGGNITVTSKNVFTNNPYGELPMPNKTGYTFTGWFAEDDVRILNETRVTITDNHTLYAQWIPNNYTVSYIFNNEDEKEEITFYYNETLTYPNEGEKRGHNFAGWNLKHEFMPAYNFTTYGCWIPNNYTVALDVNGGGELDKNEIIVTFNNIYEELPIVKRIGHTFMGWLVTNVTVDESNENEENIIVHKDGTVNITSNCTFVALWVVNNYTVTFEYPNGKNENYTISYDGPIEANVSSPSKAFYTFDRWCTEDGKICTPDGKVPAEDIVLFPHFTINAAAVSGTAVAIVAFPFLVLLLIILIFIILMVKNGMKVGHEAADVEMTFVNNDNDEEDTRLIQQMEATKISKDLEAKLMKHTKGFERNKQINEILDNLGIDPNGNKYGISESFKVAGVSSVVSNGIFSGTNLSAVSFYLSILFTNVREQEEFEEFKKLYFGMNEVDEFIDRKDEEEISFGSIISGFMDKKKVIRLLSENEEDNLPRGVLFKVQYGKGYNVGGQDEILFEMNSKFRIVRVEEIIKNRYVVVKLSYVFPGSYNEMFLF